MFAFVRLQSMPNDDQRFAEWATVLFVIQLSLGESIWSPRWYDYSMSVAPEGREGIFTAMASAPLFLGKFVTGKHLFN